MSNADISDPLMSNADITIIFKEKLQRVES